MHEQQGRILNGSTGYLYISSQNSPWFYCLSFQLSVSHAYWALKRYLTQTCSLWQDSNEEVSVLLSYSEVSHPLYLGDLCSLLLQACSKPQQPISLGKLPRTEDPCITPHAQAQGLRARVVMTATFHQSAALEGKNVDPCTPCWCKLNTASPSMLRESSLKDNTRTKRGFGKKCYTPTCA